jgi:putative acetyltransferase
LASDAVEWWVLESGGGALVGFLGFAGDTIEGLFIDPGHRQQGAGTALVAHAQSLAAGQLAVDVNEQNDPRPDHVTDVRCSPVPPRSRRTAHAGR